MKKIHLTYSPETLKRVSDITNFQNGDKQPTNKLKLYEHHKKNRTRNSSYLCSPVVFIRFTGTDYIPLEKWREKLADCKFNCQLNV